MTHRSILDLRCNMWFGAGHRLSRNKFGDPWRWGFCSLPVETQGGSEKCYPQQRTGSSTSPGGKAVRVKRSEDPIDQHHVLWHTWQSLTLADLMYRSWELEFDDGMRRHSRFKKQWNICYLPCMFQGNLTRRSIVQTFNTTNQIWQLRTSHTAMYGECQKLLFCTSFFV